MGEKPGEGESGAGNGAAAAGGGGAPERTDEGGGKPAPPKAGGGGGKPVQHGPPAGAEVRDDRGGTLTYNEKGELVYTDPSGRTGTRVGDVWQGEGGDPMPPDWTPPERWPDMKGRYASE